MIRTGFKDKSRNALLAMVIFFLGSGIGEGASRADLTIEVGGKLLEHGGVVIVYPLPVSAGVWAEAAGNEPARTIRLRDRYAEVQLRYPEGEPYTYRFRPIEGTPDADAHGTQVLSIIGTDMQDRGPQMTAGFVNAYSSGGRIIRVPPLAELAGQDEATRTMARWGETERYDAPPPADERSARSLAGIVRHGPTEILLQCEGDGLVQTCTIGDDEWPGLEARWWRAIAEARLERLRHYALRRCYDSSWFGGGTCVPVPDSDEPDYQYRK